MFTAENLTAAQIAVVRDWCALIGDRSMMVWAQTALAAARDDGKRQALARLAVAKFLNAQVTPKGGPT